MAAAGRLDPQRRHHVHVRVQPRQRALYLAQHVAVPVAHAAGVGPDLQNIVVPDIGEILLPGRRHVQEVLLVGLPAITATGTIRTLVVFTLMPDNGPDAVRQSGLPHSPEHAAVDRAGVGGIGLVSLVLIDPRAADRGVDDEDRHLLTRDEPLGKLHAPIAEFGLFAFLGLPDRIAPQVRPCALGVARRAAIAADPLAGFRRRLFAGVGRQGVGLAVDQEGVAAYQVTGRVQHLLPPIGLCAELHPVLD